MADEKLIQFYDVSLFETSDLDSVLHQMLKQIRILTSCDAGTIYLESDNYLMFRIFQNDSLGQEQITKINSTLHTIKLSIAHNTDLIAVESFVIKKMIKIDDIYAFDEYNFKGTKDFDKNFGYQTHSMLVMPILHPITQKTIGVIQIINKILDKTIVPFNDEDQKILSTASAFVALSISKLQDDIKRLEQLNKDLDVKIRIEIEKNREKDKLIFNQTKIAAMAALMSNIAHYWRQPLSIISTVASGLELKLENGLYEPEVDLHNLKEIVNATQYLSSIIENFSNTFEKGNDIETFFNPLESIYKAHQIIQENFRQNNIEIIFEIIDENISISSMKNELSQVILTILNNARDVLINKHISSKIIWIKVFKENNKCVISITDNGGGIPKEIMNRIFEPYFSTKDKSKNKDIGLFLTQSIVKNNLNGDIFCKNKEICYNDVNYLCASFIIELPL